MLNFFKGTLRAGVDKHQLPEVMIESWFPGNGGYIYFSSRVEYLTLERNLMAFSHIQGVSREQYEDAKQLYDMRNAFPQIYSAS